MIAALSRVVLTGGSRVLPSVDLAPDADPRSRLPRALTLLAAVEIPVVLAGAVGQALPLGYRDVVALVVIFAITVAVLTLVPWRRIGEGWLLVPVGAHIVFVATLVALTGGGSSPFFVLYAPLLALAGWTLRGPDLVLVIGSVATTEVWRALAVARGESVDTLTIGLPVFVLLALLAYGTSGRLAAASALLRLDAVTSAGALETVRRIEEGHADPYEQLAMEMGRLFRARSNCPGRDDKRDDAVSAGSRLEKGAEIFPQRVDTVPGAGGPALRTRPREHQRTAPEVRSRRVAGHLSSGHWT